MYDAECTRIRSNYVQSVRQQKVQKVFALNESREKKFNKKTLNFVFEM